MKILIASTTDIKGGAGKSAYRLHRALLENNFESTMVVQRKFSSDPTVIAPETLLQKIKSRITPHLDKIFIKVKFQKNKYIFSPNIISSGFLKKIIEKENPDIVHLHWIHDGFISLKDLENIEKPIVWTLHDNWVFTGGCHVLKGCINYTTECKNCPQLSNPSEEDISNKLFVLKKKLNKKKNIYFITPSTWMMNNLRRSAILANAHATRIPNIIDKKTFNEENSISSRVKLNLPQNKFIIFYGAMSALQDENKGFKYLKDAISILNSGQVFLIMAGCSSAEDLGLSCEYKAFDTITDEQELKLLYQSSNAVVVPSLEENFSNVILESLCCGSPVVAFDTGGNSDLIVHKKNGYLAILKESEDLASGLKWAIDHNPQRELESIVVESVDIFSKKATLSEHVKLYRSILNSPLFSPAEVGSEQDASTK